MVIDGVVEPLELAHLPYAKATLEDYVGERGLKRLGKKRWRKRVEHVVETLIAATEPTDVVIGGGNAKKIKDLPPPARAGSNDNAFAGGFRLWANEDSIPSGSHPSCNAGKPSPSLATLPMTDEVSQDHPA